MRVISGFVYFILIYIKISRSEIGKSWIIRNNYFFSDMRNNKRGGNFMLKSWILFSAANRRAYFLTKYFSGQKRVLKPRSSMLKRARAKSAQKTRAQFAQIDNFTATQKDICLLKPHSIFRLMLTHVLYKRPKLKQ